MNTRIALCLFHLMVLICCTSEIVPEPPNILFIMTDDHALQAISAYGHPIAQLAPTPNIDKIAKNGALFTANFCGNSICGPSRATVLTGQHSHKNEFMRNSSQGFDGSQVTLPKLLRDAGYQTAVIGKWHLVSTPKGFDHWEILIDQGEYYNPDFVKGADTMNRKGYVTEIITELTKEWLSQRDKEAPFFLMMHHKAPHRNWVPAEKYYHLFDQIEFPVPENYFDDYEGRKAAEHQKMNIYRDMYEGHDLKLSVEPGEDSLRFDPWPHVFLDRMTDEELKSFWEAYHQKNTTYFDLDPADSVGIALWKYQRYLRDYLAVVRSVDDSVGEMIDYLEENGLSENTLLVYTSDQGFYLGEHGWFDKRFMYEESFSMPLIMQLPGVIGEHLQIDLLTQNIDFAPTFLDIAGLSIPEIMQGRSFLPLLEGKQVDDWRNSLYYHYYEYPGFHSVKAHHGIRDHQHKLIYFPEDGHWELFDLHQDPMEMNNIYEHTKDEELVLNLKSEMRRLQDQYEVPSDHR